jgi:hypothetical protein
MNPFKIVNLHNEEQDCMCCYFDYKGYEISASTILKPNHIAIFDKNGYMIKTNINSIEEAIEYVNEITKEK